MTNEFSDNQSSGKERKSPFMEEGGETQWRPFRAEPVRHRCKPWTNHNRKSSRTEGETGGKTKTVKIKQEVQLSAGSRQEAVNSTDANSSQAEGNWKQKPKIEGENLEFYTWNMFCSLGPMEMGNKQKKACRSPTARLLTNQSSRWRAKVHSNDFWVKTERREKRQKSKQRDNKKEKRSRLKAVWKNRSWKDFTAGGSKISFLFSSFLYSCFTDTLWLSHQGIFHVSF